MEGISIGTEDSIRWTVGLNFRVTGMDSYGWVYTNTEDFEYALDPDLSLLSTEVLLGPKVLIEW